jgi:hypothetical protein
LVDEIKTGIVCVSVPEYLQMDIVDPSIQFTYNEIPGDPISDYQDFNAIEIKTNVKWKFEVSPRDGKTLLTSNNKSGETIPASQFEYYLGDINAIGGTLSSVGGPMIHHRFDPLSPIPITGSKDVGFLLYWKPNPNFDGSHLFAGLYTIGISYRLIKQ